jgi:cell division protein FtsB
MGLLSSALSSAVDLVGGSQIKLIVAAVVVTTAIAGVGGTIWYVKSLQKDIAQLTEDKNNLTAANKILTDNNATLKENQLKLESANSANLATIKALQGERVQATRAISQLATANATDKAALDRLNQKVEKLLKDPKNDGAVAPVLREVIRDIQKERASK